jgi:hypothetical protein
MERIIESLLFLAKPDESNSKKEINITKKTEEIIEKYKNEATIIYSHEKKNLIKKSFRKLRQKI